MDHKGSMDARDDGSSGRHNNGSFQLRPSSLSARFAPSSPTSSPAGDRQEAASSSVSQREIPTPYVPAKFTLRPSGLRAPPANPGPVPAPSFAGGNYQFAPLTPDTTQTEGAAVATGSNVASTTTSSGPTPTSSAESTSTLTSNGDPDNKEGRDTSDKEAEAKDESEAEFVFGQNLNDRAIINRAENGCEASPSDSQGPEGQVNQTSSSSSVAPTSSTELGTSTSSSTVTTNTSSTGDDQATSSGVGKRKYETLITGEEDESTVMQLFGKLYQWEAGTWREKGKGILKLNDKKRSEKMSSRLIMRTGGTLNVILNCSIVSGMNFSIAGENLKFTNIDGIFSVKGKQKDIDNMFANIQYRLRELSKRPRPIEPPIATSSIAPSSSSNVHSSNVSSSSSSTHPSTFPTVTLSSSTAGTSMSSNNNVSSTTWTGSKVTMSSSSSASVSTTPAQDVVVSTIDSANASPSSAHDDEADDEESESSNVASGVSSTTPAHEVERIRITVHRPQEDDEEEERDGEGDDDEDDDNNEVDE